MRKKLLSLALALALSLGLTVPTFAAGSEWKLEVPGKSNAEVFVGERTFTVRDWDWSQESRYNAEYDYEETVHIATKTDSRQYTAKNLYVLSKGDTAVFTKGGESFYSFNMTAWSDPDGDGVYDSRLPDVTGDYGYKFLPADASSPQTSEYLYSAYFQFGMVNWELWNPGGDHPVSEYGSWDPYGFPALAVTEVKMAPDMLLELFGPNTLVSVTAWDENADDPINVCTILVEGNIQPTQPTTPAQPEQPAGATASPTNDKLAVNGAAQNPTVYKIGGSNYFKIRDVAALLNGTEKQFAVGYDGQLKSVTATTGQGYARQPGDLAGAPAGGDKTAEISSDTIYVNGEKVDAEVYKIDGSNYFKLRDLGKALDFYVGWSQERGVYIETDKPYS